MFRFTVIFAGELIKSNFEIARLVLKPRMSFRPAILVFRHRCRSRLELTMLANCITLTPGTLVVDLSEKDSLLYVHALCAEDPAAVIAAIETRLAQPIREIFE